MKHTEIQHSFIALKQNKKKAFAVLVDPDNIHPERIKLLADTYKNAQVDYIFMGGSIMLTHHMDECIQLFKTHCTIPIILFPGSPSQVSKYADGLLYLSLLSGRNPELLIGAHVVSAPMVKASGIEIIPTGYLLVDGGKATTVSYMSHSNPIPHDKDDIALCTALAGEMLGKQVIYMDAGSGALNPISESMIQRVSSNIDIPTIVGGGIKTPEKAVAICNAGADIIVVGNAAENNLTLISNIANAVHRL